LGWGLTGPSTCSGNKFPISLPGLLSNDAGIPTGPVHLAKEATRGVAVGKFLPNALAPAGVLNCNRGLSATPRSPLPAPPAACCLLPALCSLPARQPPAKYPVDFCTLIEYKDVNKKLGIERSADPYKGRVSKEPAGRLATSPSARGLFSLPMVSAQSAIRRAGRTRVPGRHLRAHAEP
jgi:hypothetical protein